jgi:3-dehydro-L-gulonate 2-dehydrogenase
MIRVSLADMQQEFRRVLLKGGFAPERAALCARIFAETSLDGVASHGVNRFPNFIEQIRKGYIKVQAEPERIAAMGTWEQWDGHLGPGPLNAFTSTERALALAREHGLGCVALRNTNHWMRGGAYGWHAAEAGFVFLAWTNTMPNMPPWSARETRIGNNPLVLAVPRSAGPVVLDMAMSQFSYGRLETTRRRQEQLPLAGGFDIHGNLTQDPEAIINSQRPLPIGYWKGSSLSLLLDLMAALLSGGQTTYQIGQQVAEFNISQMFIAFDLTKAASAAMADQVINEVLADLHSATPATEGDNILYPGERVLKTRRENMVKGIPVDPAIWQQVLEL